MLLGSFKPINRIKANGSGLLEFRDTPRKEDSTRILQVSTNAGWIRYYDSRAEMRPPHAVPSPAEAERKALAYFVMFGGRTNELQPNAWKHLENKYEAFGKTGSNLLHKGVSRHYVETLRELEHIPLIGSAFSIHFGSDSKPINLEFNWPPVSPVARCKCLTANELLQCLKSGKAFYPMWPEPPQVSGARAYKVKSIQYLYRTGLGTDPEQPLRPYASLGMEADVNGKSVDFCLYCPIITDERLQ